MSKMTPGRRFRFLLTARALAWNPNPATVSMPQQLRWIAAAAERSAVDVRLLPDDAEPVGPWASFTVHDVDRPGVTIELDHRNELVVDVDDVARYRRRFREMWEAAVLL